MSAPTSRLVFGGETYTRMELEQSSPYDLEQLLLGAVTYECWINPTNFDSPPGGNPFLWSYHNYIMEFRIGSNNQVEKYRGALLLDLSCSGDDAKSWTNEKLILDSWQHIAITWDNDGDRYLRAFIGGIQATYETQVQGGGNPNLFFDLVTRFANSYYYAEGDDYFTGKASWLRISDTVRYTSNFTPPPRCTLPAIDGSTIGQWIGPDGVGPGEGVASRLIDNQEGTAEYDADTWSAWEEEDDCAYVDMPGTFLSNVMLGEI